MYLALIEAEAPAPTQAIDSPASINPPIEPHWETADITNEVVLGVFDIAYLPVLTPAVSQWNKAIVSFNPKTETLT